MLAADSSLTFGSGGAPPIRRGFQSSCGAAPGIVLIDRVDSTVAI